MPHYFEKMYRNDFLDVVKGLLITLVCIGHSSQYIIHQDGEFWSDPLFKAIYMFHKPLFMAISGYLSFNGLSQTPSLVGYVKRRAISLLLPIYCWAVLYKTSVFLLAGHNSLMQLPFEIIRFAISSLWFLWALLGSIVLTAIAVSTRKYRYSVLIGLVLFAILVLPDRCNLHLFKYTFLFFIVGYFYASFEITKDKLTEFKFLIFPFAIASCICFLFWDKNTYIYVTGMQLTAENLYNIIFRWLSGIVLSTFVLLIIDRFSSDIPEKIKKWIILAGRNSIHIYILQSYVIMFLFRTTKRFLEPFSNIILGDFFAVLIGIFVTLLCLLIGSSISQNKYAAYFLFGKNIATDTTHNN